MPAFNASGFIETTIDSVLQQTHSALELIIVDDCSTDRTVEIARSKAAADRRVRLILLDRNRGAPAAPRNIGVRAARAEWIAFIDADDIWHPSKLACQLAVLESTGSKFCSTQMFDFSDEKQVEFEPLGSPRIERVGFVKQLVRYRTPTSSVVAEAGLLRRHPFNEDLSYKAREDVDCWLHCHEEIGTSVKIKHPLVGYRIVPGQISGKKWQMMRRHHHVLREYRFASGRGLGPGALLFTISHFLLALYYRVLKRTL
jgi:teichuronic acid biosynthesis glycosyltransferase TuaG